MYNFINIYTRCQDAIFIFLTNKFDNLNGQIMLQKKKRQNSMCKTQDPNKLITSFIDYVLINRKKISLMFLNSW